MYRIGNGYDVHAFTEGDSIVLGGVQIPHDKSFLAHSDGDVLIHALIDALLGALALGDIGQLFPDTDNQYENIDSSSLLKKVYSRVQKKQYQLVNCDCTIVAQSPKMEPHINSMKEIISKVLSVKNNQISIKATTTENLGFTGRKEGVAVYAVVLLQYIERDMGN